jgi:hypothetical protein
MHVELSGASHMPCIQPLLLYGQLLSAIGLKWQVCRSCLLGLGYAECCGPQ